MCLEKRMVVSEMPGPAIPLIIGAGARILAGQAAKQGAKRVAARTGAKRTKARGGRSYANTEAKAGVKAGQLPGGGRYASKSVTARKRAVPSKPSARSNSAKYRGRKKK